MHGCGLLRCGPRRLQPIPCNNRLHGKKKEKKPLIDIKRKNELFILHINRRRKHILIFFSSPQKDRKKNVQRLWWELMFFCIGNNKNK